ncbi:ATP-binding protein [Desulfolucanica intricata]|uniref:ATP-binding protein n=1 Tax=Desulfolucanica intricata TaxID=1285191 RepID=UPI00082ACFA2|nr:ATP-binding protein [Desulfolucanica intricata]
MKPMFQKKSLLLSRLIPPFVKESVRFKLVAVVFLVLIALETTNFYLSYRHEMQKGTEQINKNFSLIADILDNDISRWLAGRKSDVVSMTENPLIQQYINEIVTGTGDPAGAEKRLREYWKTIQEQYDIYDEIYFITRTGKILVSTDSGREGTLRPRDDLINKPLSTGDIYFQDAYLSYNTKKPSIAFSVPVISERISNDTVHYNGVIVYRVDIGDVLQPLLDSRVSLGDTGEVILINEYKTAISELRSRPGSALRYNLKSEAALRVSQGEEGILRGIGYNGKENISVYRYIPEVRWGLIVRQDTSEIFGPLQEQMRRSLYANIITFVLVLGILYFALSRMLKPITSMAEAAGEISKGDFSRRLPVKTNDEIGVLGNTLNYMTDELGKLFKLQQSREEVLQSLVTNLAVDDILNKGLSTVCNSFNFKVGAIFLVDPNKELLVRRALYCPGQQLIEQRDVIKIEEGLEGLAVSTRQVQVINNSPEDTVYTINWLGGNILPKTIVEVPLVLGTGALGVMSLASLNGISEREIQALSTIGAVLGVAVNNALSYEKTVELSRSLQEMNEELAQQNEELHAQSEELQCQTEELQAQSEELEAITRELQEKNAELEKVDRRKTNYLSELSHELRAPLNAVIGFSDVLLDKVVGELNPQQEKYLHEILNSGQHLLNLINDLLDLSKIEAGQTELNIQEIDPALPLAEAISMVSAEVTRKQLEVINLITENDYIVAADRDKLKQVFLNLLTNAVKFTPEGGKITIGARCKNKVIEMWVSDTGIGIAKEYHDQIFDDFKQAGNISKAYGGTGLGLAITKKLLNLQGGRIGVDSEEGQGATFTFILPRGLEQNNILFGQLYCSISCPEQGGCDNCDCPRSTINYLKKPLDKEDLLAKVSKVNCQMVGNPPTVLVVDDDPVVRSYVSALLETRGYKLVAAEDGQQGVEIALSTKPDIIILDIIMPELDGFQVMDKISETNWEKGLSVFICTSKELTAEQKEFLESRMKKVYKNREKA